MKGKTKILLGSALSIAMCASLIAGSTFALFSSEDKVNIAITSGKVNVTAAIKEDTLNVWSYTEQSDGSYESTDMKGHVFATGGAASFEGEDADLTLSEIVPGDKAEFDIELTNESTISVKYQLAVTTAGDAKLFDALHITFGELTLIDSSFIAGSSSTAWSKWEPSEGSTKTIHVAVELPYDTDDTIVNGDETNSIQGKTCSLQFAVKAVQGNGKTDDPEADKLNIFSLEEFLAFAKGTATESYKGEVIHLKTDLDMSKVASLSAVAEGHSHAIALLAASVEETSGRQPIGTNEHPFAGTFDGEGHTIYNLHVNSSSPSLFGYVQGATIENLNFVDVERESGAGIIVGTVVASDSATTITNVTVALAEHTVIEEEAKNGGLVGSAGDANLTITDTAVESSGGSEHVWDEKGEEEDKKFLDHVAEGFDKFQITKDGEEPKEVYEVSSEAGIAGFAGMVNDSGNPDRLFEGKTVTLTKDLDMQGKDWDMVGRNNAAGIHFSGTFDGGNHTIKNVNLTSENIGSVDQVGLFGSVKAATIKNLNIKNVTVNLKAGTTNSVGILVGNPTGICVFEEIHISGIINISTSAKMVGGLIGHLGDAYGQETGTYTEIKNCTIDGTDAAQSTIKGTNNIGGLFGSSDQTIEVTDCEVKNLTLKGTDKYTYTGGIVGRTSKVSAVSCVVNYVTAEGEKYVGGLVGYSEFVMTTNGNSLQNVTLKGAQNVGGLVGYIGGNKNESATLAKDSLQSVVIEQTKEVAKGEDMLFGAIAGELQGVGQCTSTDTIPGWGEHTQTDGYTYTISNITANVTLKLLQEMDQTNETFEEMRADTSSHRPGNGLKLKAFGDTRLCAGYIKQGVSYTSSEDGKYSDLSLGETSLKFDEATSITVALSIAGAAATTYINGAPQA